MTLDLGYLVGTLIFSCRVDRSFERLAVWHEQTGDYDTEIHAGRLDASGEPLDPVPVLVGGAGARYDQVAFNGTDFVVTWGTATTFTITRISPEGVKDPPDTGQPGGGPPSVAGGSEAISPCGSGYINRSFELVVYRRQPVGTPIPSFRRPACQPLTELAPLCLGDRRAIRHIRIYRLRAGGRSAIDIARCRANFGERIELG